MHCYFDTVPSLLLLQLINFCFFIISCKIANSVAAGLTFVQLTWLLVLRIIHREVVGQITDVESLRSVFLSVSRSLKRLAAAPPTTTFWTQDYILKLEDSLDTGWQSLSLMERTFCRLEVELAEKADSLAGAVAAATEAAANEARVSNQLVTSNAIAAVTSANAALSLCRSFLGICRTTMLALDGIKLATKVKIPDDPREENKLKDSINVASEAMRGLADHLRSSIQIINASEGIPSTIKIAFNFCRQQILSIKACADSKFLRFGCGAFSLRKRVHCW